MRFDSGIPVVGGSFVADTSGRTQSTAGPIWPTELMPFTIRIARSADQLEKAVQIRYRAYARHVPIIAEKLKDAEEYDFDSGSVVLLAESKLDGSPLGTMRIQTNLHRELPVERAVDLPRWLQGKSLAEATRLGVSEGRVGRVVKTMLFKAYFLYCLDRCVDWMVVGGRHPLDRQYEALLFKDVFPGGGFVPLPYAGNIPHRIMAFEPSTAEATWSAARHPLFDFIFRTRHPDLEVDGSQIVFRGTYPHPRSEPPARRRLAYELRPALPMI